MQKVEKLVQEDLNPGTERVWVAAPGGGKLCATQTGLHTFARGQRAYTATWAPGSIGAGSKASTTVSVPDAVTGDFVMASHTTQGDTGLTIHGHISADGTATVVIHNPTASAVTVSSGTVGVLVFGAVAAQPGGEIYGTVSNGEAGNWNGASVYLYAAADTTTPIDTTISANNGVSDGQYRFTGLTVGDYYVRAIDGSSGAWVSVTLATEEPLEAGILAIQNPESPAWPPV